MPITYRDILGRLNKLNLLHRIYIQRAAARNRICFGQIPLLEYAMDHEACTQKDIADFLQVSPPTVAAAVKRLEKSGMLQRTADQKDLRCNRLTVTETGKAYVESCRRAFDDVDALAFRGFREEECQALYGDRRVPGAVLPLPGGRGKAAPQRHETGRKKGGRRV